MADLGYNNFANSLIIEFDFEKDSDDPDDNSFSVRYCSTTCSSSDKNAIKNGKLISQTYNPNQENIWDFRLIYENKIIYIYSGQNEILYSFNFDLEEKLGTDIGYVGFTGLIESNSRHISLIGSFICEDNFDMNKINGDFFDGGKKYDTMEYEAGTTINYVFPFINSKNQQVPHTFGFNIWDYSFSLNSGCGVPSQTITYYDKYNLILSMNTCTKAGKYSIYISEANKGNGPSKEYTIIPGPLKEINLIGHDGIIGEVPSKYILNTTYLTYGDSKTGDFLFKNGLSLILDFNIIDKYGNLVNATSSLFTLKKVNDDGTTSAVNTKIISQTLIQKDNRYQMLISVNQIGTYEIESNQYLSQSIRFTIIPNDVDIQQSYCTIQNYSSSAIIYQQDKIIYNCYLRDFNGNEISTKIFNENSNYDFECNVLRSKPSTKSYKISYEDEGSYFSCEFNISDIGTYQIDGSIIRKGTITSTNINSKINTIN